MRASKILLLVVLTVAAIMLNHFSYGVRHLAYCKAECILGSNASKHKCPQGCHCVVRDSNKATGKGHCWKLPKSEIPNSTHSKG
uniref:8 kDa Amblyomma family member n=1 Tax=Rhipicephalus appendiculatus TaxID=34631 RepID=A0A131Y9D5_RHIAP